MQKYQGFFCLLGVFFRLTVKCSTYFRGLTQTFERLCEQQLAWLRYYAKKNYAAAKALFSSVSKGSRGGRSRARWEQKCVGRHHHHHTWLVDVFWLTKRWPSALLSLHYKQYMTAQTVNSVIEKSWQDHPDRLQQLGEYNTHVSATTTIIIKLKLPSQMMKVML